MTDRIHSHLVDPTKRIRRKKNEIVNIKMYDTLCKIEYQHGNYNNNSVDIPVTSNNRELWQVLLTFILIIHSLRLTV